MGGKSLLRADGIKAGMAIGQFLEFRQVAQCLGEHPRREVGALVHLQHAKPAVEAPAGQGWASRQGQRFQALGQEAQSPQGGAGSPRRGLIRNIL